MSHTECHVLPDRCHPIKDAYSHCEVTLYPLYCVFNRCVFVGLSLMPKYACVFFFLIKSHDKRQISFFLPHTHTHIYKLVMDWTVCHVVGVNCIITVFM